MAYRYEWYKSRGICPNCKCRKLQPNRSRCAYCLAADAARAKRRRKEKKKTMTYNVVSTCKDKT